MNPFSIVVAATKTGGIGKDGRIPWRLPRDIAFFKHLTTNGFRKPNDPKLNAVIMGRKTWDSIPSKFRPLPDRINVILTQNPEALKPSLPPTAYAFSSLHEALQWTTQAPISHVFVIGGSEIYTEALRHPKCEYLFFTAVDLVCECDTMFPLNTPYFQFQSPEPWSALQTIVNDPTLPSGKIEDQGTTIQFQLYRRVKEQTG